MATISSSTISSGPDAHIQQAIKFSLEKLGYEALKPLQERVVQEFLSGKDVFASLPTGYGKSLCYACLPHAFDCMRGREGSIVICVSPLTSLMIDQRAKFVPRGLLAEFVGETQCDPLALDSVREGRVQLLFISPESILSNPQWRDMLRTATYRDNLTGFVVDEAHCVKKWGDDFREDFARLGEIRSLIPKHVNILALTATATKPTRKAVIKRLNMQKPVIISVTPNKPNIVYRLQEKDSSMKESLAPLIRQLQQQEIQSDQKIIIFCKRYEECSRMYWIFKTALRNRFTQPEGAPDLARFRVVDMYTKCTETSVKESIISSFCLESSPLRIVIATIAFGMGLDSPFVRQVIHWGPSDTIEDYVQESGRCGRDGKLACALLLFAKADQQYTKKAMIEYCKNTVQCRRNLLYQDFDDADKITAPPTKCTCCDVCAKHCICGHCKEIYSNFLL